MSDKKTPAKSQSIALAVVALLTGILFGIVATHLFSGDSQVIDGNDDGISQAESDLRTNLNSLAVEHVNLLAEYQQAVYENDASQEALAANLNENADELAGTVNAVTAGDDREEFTELWSEARDSLEAYMLAARDGEAEDVAIAREATLQSAGEWTAYIVGISGLDGENLEEDGQLLADDWMRMTDSYIAGNYQESYEARRSVVEQVRSLTDEIAGALAEEDSEAF